MTKDTYVWNAASAARDTYHTNVGENGDKQPLTVRCGYYSVHGRGNRLACLVAQNACADFEECRKVCCRQNLHLEGRSSSDLPTKEGPNLFPLLLRPVYCKADRVQWDEPSTSYAKANTMKLLRRSQQNCARHTANKIWTPKTCSINVSRVTSQRRSTNPIFRKRTLIDEFATRV